MKRLLLALAAYPLLAQTITTSAGNSTWGRITAVEVDAQGNQYAADLDEGVVYKIDRLGAVTVVAGNGSFASNGDGGLATEAAMRFPQGLGLGPDGSLYIAEDTASNARGVRIRKVAPDGIITTFAGIGTCGFSGDGGPANQARICGAQDILVASDGTVYFADADNYRIRSVSPDGTIQTIAGTGTGGFSGDGGPPLLADIVPHYLALAEDDTLYFSNDANSTSNERTRRVRKISPDRTMVTTVAGNGNTSDLGDGGPATDASFQSVAGIALDSAGNLYVADPASSRVRRVGPDGIIQAYAGTGRAGTSGDGGPARDAQLDYPIALATDTMGNLYIADYDASRIRKVTPAAGPEITHANPAFLGAGGISSNMYLEIFGENLANTQRVWGDADFDGPNAPTGLDGTRVMVNGKPAFVYFISPQQVNINVPDDTATGPVDLQVITEAGASNTISVERGAVSPSLQSVPQFLVDGVQHVVAQTADFSSFIGIPGMLQGVRFTRARPGQTVIIYALGCGPTTPATTAGQVNPANAPLALPFEVRIGGVAANVSFAGMAASTIGLYQFNVEIPQVPEGLQAIELSVDGVANEQNLFIAVGS